MRLVDTLISGDAESGTTETTVQSNGLLVDSSGRLDPAALPEMIAQSYAAVRGCDDIRNGRPIGKGFLVGLRKIRIEAEVCAGDRLLTSVRTTGTFDAFAVVEGEVTRDGDLIASGTLKLWIASASTPEGAT